MEMSNHDISKHLRTIVDRCKEHIRILNFTGLELDKFLDVNAINENWLSHWQKIKKLTLEKMNCVYLNNIQQQNKQVVEQNNIKEGCVVILKDEKLPFGKWSLGRILNVKYGPDKKARIFEIQTASGLVQRYFKNLCFTH